MKMYLGDTPLRSVMTHTDTDDATMKASDLQVGVIGYSKGQKVTGTGKAFSFASYGTVKTNMSFPALADINTIELTSTECPVQSLLTFEDIRNTDFSAEQIIGNAIKDSVTYPIKLKVASDILSVACDITISIQLFYGKDDYI